MLKEVEFDYAGWQLRMQFDVPQAAAALDISTSMFSTLKRNGRGRKLYAWAAYGIECAEKTKK